MAAAGCRIRIIASRASTNTGTVLEILVIGDSVWVAASADGYWRGTFLTVAVAGYCEPDLSARQTGVCRVNIITV